MQRIARFILAHPVFAVLVGGGFGGLAQKMFLLALPGAAAVSLYLLRKGGAQSLLVLLGATLLTVAVGLLLEGRPGFDYPMALLLIVPSALGAMALRGSQSQGLAVAWISVCATAFAFAVQFLTGDAAQWWGGWLEIALQGIPRSAMATVEEQVPTYVNGVAALLLGLLACACLCWARAVQAQLFNPGGFAREFGELRVPRWIVGFLLLAMVAAAAVNWQLFYDIALLLALPFCMQGLAVMQHTADKNKLDKFFSVFPYLLLLLSPQNMVIGYACLGGVDCFVNFRKLPKAAP